MPAHTMMDFQFAEPWFFLLLPIALLPFLGLARSGAAGFSATGLTTGLRSSRGPFFYALIMSIAIVLSVIALARPQYGKQVKVVEQEGRDLMLVVDLSGSMQYDDMVDGDQRQDRLAAVMQAAKQFIEGRASDRIGLVVFAEHAYTSCPITYDHQTLHNFLTRIERQQRQMWEHKGSLVGNGTNIGLGLGTAIRRLNHEEKSERLGSAVILITDGQDSKNLENWVDPIQAAQSAKHLSIKIYGIGVGDPNGTYTATDGFGRQRLRRLRSEMLPSIKRLRQITDEAGGVAFSATDPSGLDQVFSQIDQLETTPKEIRFRDHYSDRFFIPLLASLLFALFGFLCEPFLRGPR